MSVININEFKMVKEFKQAQDLLLELHDYSEKEPAFSMAAAAMWIGHRLAMLPPEENQAAIRDMIVSLIDDELKRHAKA